MAQKTTLHDIDKMAGDHFDGAALSRNDWVVRAESFVSAMASCDRAVILTLDDKGYLQLSSIPSSVNQIVELRRSSSVPRS